MRPTLKSIYWIDFARQCAGSNPHPSTPAFAGAGSTQDAGSEAEFAFA